MARVRGVMQDDGAEFVGVYLTPQAAQITLRLIESMKAYIVALEQELGRHDDRPLYERIGLTRSEIE